MSRNWPNGGTRAWRRIRRQVLRDNAEYEGGLCQLALKGVCTTLATTVHHTRPRAEVGDDKRYLIATCQDCNWKVGEPGTTPPKPKRVSSWSNP